MKSVKPRQIQPENFMTNTKTEEKEGPDLSEGRKSGIIKDNQSYPVLDQSATLGLPELSFRLNQSLENSQKQPQSINVQFYTNKAASRPNGQFIDTIHKKWYYDYEKLERDHSFIQWLFPNSFQSRFNSQAQPLSVSERQQFKSSLAILERYKRSYQMMLGFYGMKMKNEITGELARSRKPNYKERYYRTFLTSFHNHMRITRILCSLTEIGFGRYAVELCKFLKAEIQSPLGELASLHKFNVYKEWQIYENFTQTEDNSNALIKLLNKKQKPIFKESLVPEESKMETKLPIASQVKSSVNHEINK